MRVLFSKKYKLNMKIIRRFKMTTLYRIAKSTTNVLVAKHVSPKNRLANTSSVHLNIGRRMFEKRPLTRLRYDVLCHLIRRADVFASVMSCWAWLITCAHQRCKNPAGRISQLPRSPSLGTLWPANFERSVLLFPDARWQ